MNNLGRQEIEKKPTINTYMSHRSRPQLPRIPWRWNECSQPLGVLFCFTWGRMKKWSIDRCQYRYPGNIARFMPQPIEGEIDPAQRF